MIIGQNERPKNYHGKIDASTIKKSVSIIYTMVDNYTLMVFLF